MGTSNRIPEWIAAYWLEAVESLGCLPAHQRSDRGAENSIAAAVQQHFNGEDTHTFGRSVANQRIESWWNQLYAGGIQFWIDNFKNLEAHSLYNADDNYELRCSYYIFGDLIQQSLNQIYDDWNSHTMRKSSKNPGGVPDFLYSHPELYGAHESGLAVPPLLRRYVNATFPGTCIDLSNLFNTKWDYDVFQLRFP
jgi:hypothetical protein